MKIIGLKIENFKRIKAVEIKSDKDFIEITGKNGQGKTSVLDAIEGALCGKASLPERPIRDGQTQANIQVDIGDYIVHRKFSASGSSLMIVSKNGDVKSSPQEFLNKIVGDLSFDPLKFVMMETKKRTEIFKRILGINTDDLVNKHQSLYLQRRDAGNLLERIKALYNSLVIYSEDVEVPDLREIQQQRDTAINNNDSLNEINERLHDLSTENNLAFKEIERLTLLIESNKSEINRMEAFILNTKLIDIKQFDDQFNSIQSLMQKKSKHADYKTAKNDFEQASKMYNSLQEKIEENIAEQKSMMQSVKMPIDGLELRDTELYFKGIPFDQLSQAEQLTISMSMAIAENPELKFVRIENGSLLDKKSLDLLKQINREKGFQVWIETVSDEPGKPDALFIEEGEVLE